MIETSHLKIILALHNKGTLTEAANTLCLSQSALSHQIRYLEKKLDLSLWQREGRTLRLTQAGELLLQTAQQVLPVLEQSEKTLKAYGEGRQGVLRIGVECYPCYQWLSHTIGDFLQAMPDVDIDMVNKFQFSGLEGLLSHHIDLLVTPDKEKNPKILYQILAGYELRLLVAKQHPLAKKSYVVAEDLAPENLLTFPVSHKRLDIFTEFLNPAHIKPNHKNIESIELMLQMVGLNRGLCVLPQWLHVDNPNIQTLGLGEQGLHKQLFIALRQTDKDIAYIDKFITVGKQIAKHSFCV